MSDIVNKNENLELELEDNTILSNLFGINDRNLSLIEQINQVKIQYRGNKIKISGNKKSIFETKKTILNLFKEAQNGAEIDEDRIRDNKSLISMNIKSDKQMDLFIQTKKRKIIPRTEIQNKYLQLLNTKNITFAIGPLPISILDSNTIPFASVSKSVFRSNISACKTTLSTNLSKFCFVLVDISTINVSPDKSSAISSYSKS